jgi:hypothetical protein
MHEFISSCMYDLATAKSRVCNLSKRCLVILLSFFSVWEISQVTTDITDLEAIAKQFWKRCVHCWLCGLLDEF